MRASFYESDITPPLGGYLYGNYCEQIADGVAEKLYAKALVVEDGGNIAAMVAIDSCTIPADLHDIVTKRIYDYTGIAPECVSISSTHTHKGIPIHDSPDINCFADDAYRDVCYRLIADAVILAYKRLGDEEVEVSYGTGEVKDVAHNRNGEVADGTYRTHVRMRDDLVRPIGEVDESLNIITFSKNGKKIGAVVNFSCHLDCTGGKKMEYSGDYAAVLSGILKEKYGSDFVSLFVTGACGNVNHHPSDKNVPVKTYIRIGQEIAEEALKVIENSKPVAGGVSVCKELIEIERRKPDEATVDKINNKGTDKPMREMLLMNYMYYKHTNKETHSKLYVQSIRIGDVALAVLPGEIYASTGLAIKAKSPFAKTIVVENSNSSCGYVPTRDLFGDNCLLYESMLCYGSCLVPEASDIIESKALELLKKI